MTNEEKAIELQQNDVCMVWNNGCPNVRESALKMAKWKDENIINALQKEVEKYDNELDHIAETDVAKSIILTTYKEAFKKAIQIVKTLF